MVSICYSHQCIRADDVQDDLALAIDRSEQADNDHTGSDGALELAAYWSKTCITNHEKCRPLAAKDVATFVPTRLLDIGNGSIRLIESKYEMEATADRSYVALSHCWGLVPIIRTLKENYAEHRKRIAPERLSKTFREAIHATRKLGYRYIWIDSLCIIQDDGDDWAEEAATMCDVYQSAILTIAAAHAPGGDVGCFAARDGLIQIPFYIELPLAIPGVTPPKIKFSSYGRTSEAGGSDAALFGRAWVLQEQILSPRMLMFDGTHLGWECLTIHGSENSPTSGTTRHALYHKYMRTGVMDDDEYFDHPDATDDVGQTHTFWSLLKHQYWCELVMDYTHRGMTKPKDRLVALAGIAKAITRHTTHGYWAGLWSQHFTTGLLWSISHNEIFATWAANTAVPKDATTRHEQPLAPTWSWASVTTPVMYSETELLSYDPMCEVVNVSVAGDIDKQTGRATIRGHIRRGYVNPIYPHHIQEAVVSLPHMSGAPPNGRKGLEYVNFKGRLFHPGDYFLFSDVYPAAKCKDISPSSVSKNGGFRLVRGAFRPDEMIDPCTEITFIAIAQQHYGSQLTSMLHKHTDDAAIKVHALALVPTGNSHGEYRRVGLAIWDECAWYGYLCGWKDERDRRVYRPGNYSANGYLQDDTWRDKLARKSWWNDLEAYDECKQGAHEHEYEKNAVPELGMYHPRVDVAESTVIIV
jgi:hypothetical protein